MRKQLLFALVAVAVFAGCQKKAEAPAAPAAAAPAAPAATEPAPEPAAAPPAQAEFGVAECDNYVQKYLECIDTKVPEAARQQIRDSFEQTRAAWRQAAATEAGRAALATGCIQATDAAKAAMAAYGCTF